jgi:hypothetical protein
MKVITIDYHMFLYYSWLSFFSKFNFDTLQTNYYFWKKNDPLLFFILFIWMLDIV